MEAKLGLLAALVGAASESELTARAADSAHATWSTMQALGLGLGLRLGLGLGLATLTLTITLTTWSTMQAEAEARHGKREREATRAGVA